MYKKFHGFFPRNFLLKNVRKIVSWAKLLMSYFFTHLRLLLGRLLPSLTGISHRVMLKNGVRE
jgi:hypothetical protein